MRWTVPGAVVDEPLAPWVEFASVNLKTGEIVVRIADAYRDARCPECGLAHEDEAD